MHVNNKKYIGKRVYGFNWNEPHWCQMWMLDTIRKEGNREMSVSLSNWGVLGSIRLPYRPHLLSITFHPFQIFYILQSHIKFWFNCTGHTHVCSFQRSFVFDNFSITKQNQSRIIWPFLTAWSKRFFDDQMMTLLMETTHCYVDYIPFKKRTVPILMLCCLPHTTGTCTLLRSYLSTRSMSN